MKVVIDIPEGMYQCVKDDTYCGSFYLELKNGTPLDSIISQIEAARDKDKLCEYPYNRCIDILTRTD